MGESSRNSILGLIDNDAGNVNGKIRCEISEMRDG